MNRRVIVGNHLAKDMSSGTKMMMLPAKEGTCQECATEHEPETAHNAQSMFYQYKFYNDHGRWPNWKDAMAHCSATMKAMWREHLGKVGVDVEAGEVNPKRKKK